MSSHLTLSGQRSLKEEVQERVARIQADMSTTPTSPQISSEATAWSRNREATWLATGVLGTAVFATLVLAVQERQPNANDLTEQRQTEGDLLLNPCGAANSDRGPNS